MHTRSGALPAARVICGRRCSRRRGRRRRRQGDKTETKMNEPLRERSGPRLATKKARRPEWPPPPNPGRVVSCHRRPRLPGRASAQRRNRAAAPADGAPPLKLMIIRMNSIADRRRRRAPSHGANPLAANKMRRPFVVGAGALLFAGTRSSNRMNDTQRGDDETTAPTGGRQVVWSLQAN
jgi:hypothetical protein